MKGFICCEKEVCLCFTHAGETIMIRILIIIFILILGTTPTFAEKWIQLETGYEVDVDSLQEYYIPNRTNLYSIWTKSYNNGSNNFHPDDAYFNNQIIMDCDSAKYTIKRAQTYNKRGFVIPQSVFHITNESLSWVNVTPYSKSELLFNYVCQPNIKKGVINNNSAPNSNDTVNLYKNNVDSMVYIETQDSSGSGEIIKPDGTFVTCFHVIANADYITVRLNDGSTYNVNGFKYINPLSDVAILTLDTTRQFKPIKLSPRNAIDIGEKIYTISNPQGVFKFAFSDGMVSQYTRDYIQFTAPISPGSSGGALLDKNGYLLGIITSYWAEEGSQNINFALPNEYFQSKINNVAIKNYKNQNWTDFVVDNANEEQFKLYTEYAYNKESYGLLYKYLKPFTKRADFPKEYYSQFGFLAICAYLDEENLVYLNDAIDWYELAYKNNSYDEATIIGLTLAYSISCSIINNEADYKRIIYFLDQLKKYYPASYKIISTLGECSTEECYEEKAIELFEYLISLYDARK